jgi:Tetracyclin repressor-like, C-terminal domain
MMEQGIDDQCDSDVPLTRFRPDSRYQLYYRNYRRAVSVLARILERGYAAGAFRRRVEAIDVHLLISAFCFFRMSNRYTFGAIFGLDLIDPDRRDHYRTMIGDIVVSYLTT